MSKTTVGRRCCKKKSLFPKIVIWIVALGIFSSAQQLRASGFTIYEIGSRAASLAGAFAAHVDDASAIYYNPAGMVSLRGIRVKTNILFSSMTITATQDPGVRYESRFLDLRGAHFLTWSLFNRVSIGLGFFNPYLAETNWMKENPYSYYTKFNIFTIRPAFALKILRGLSVGFGVDFDIASLNWAHSVDRWNGLYRLFQYRSYYELKGNGVGYVVGILWKIGTRFQMGGRYQHKVKSSLSGSNYTRGGVGLPFSTVNGSITLPAELVLGVKLVPLNNLSLCLDFKRNSWSQTKGWTLKFDERQDHWDPYHYDEYWANLFQYSIETANQNAEQKLKDTWDFKFGLEYNLSDKFAFRTGYAHLPSSVIEGAVHLIHPDLDRKIVTFGFGYEGPLFSIWDQKSIGELSLDFYVQYVMTETQASSLPGFSFTFDNDHWVIGLGLGFNFNSF